MPQPQFLDPSPFDADRGPVGVLLFHGFTGSVAETRPMGQYLAERGMTVRCPLLPGHGTTAEDLTHIDRQEWLEATAAAYRELQACCETLFVGGMSMGSILALWLGAQHPGIAGLIAMSPAVKVQNRLLPLTLGLRYLLKYDPTASLGEEDLGDPEAIDRIWCYDETPLWGAAEFYLLQRQVREVLPEIDQPLLIFQGRHDATLSPQAADILYANAASTDKTLVWLENSGHNVLVDGERESVWEKSFAWMMERLPPGRD